MVQLCFVVSYSRLVIQDAGFDATNGHACDRCVRRAFGNATEARAFCSSRSVCVWYHLHPCSPVTCRHSDDLGRNDLSHFNGGLSETPAIDDLLSNGIFLESYYTFKVTGSMLGMFFHHVSTPDHFFVGLLGTSTWTAARRYCLTTVSRLNFLQPSRTSIMSGRYAWRTGMLN